MNANDARREAVNAYLSEEIHTVGGWCIPFLWQTIWPLAKEIGAGPIAEIGVFEGKFLLGLAKTFGVGSGPRAAAIDVFDMQEFNLDHAGAGKLDVLKTNINRLGFEERDFGFVRADSLSLTSRDAAGLVDEYGQFAFFSVDGCHEVVHTMRDVEFAMTVTAPHGIIAVDDYTNPNWPGVQEAIAKMYLLREFPFVPLAVTCNKMLLCSFSHHAKYLKLIQAYVQANHPGTRMKKVVRFGFDSLTVQPKLGDWQALV